MKTQHIPRTREFLGNRSSSLNLIRGKDYRKIVHVNGNEIALHFYIKNSEGRWDPMTGTDYIPFDPDHLERIPGFILRHIVKDKIQDYMESRRNHEYQKYSLGLHFENGQLVEI